MRKLRRSVQRSRKSSPNNGSRSVPEPISLGTVQPAGGVPLIFENAEAGRANTYFASEGGLKERLPQSVLRLALPLPDHSELDVVRHFTALSQRTFSIDSGFYPLGSCTMKYNPRVNDAMANLPGFRELHPLVPDEMAQGALALMYDLERLLSNIFGMAAFSLNPAAGAHAELAALLIAKAYFRDKGEGARRTTVIVPDTAHGTNPASAAMVGYRVLSLRSDARGRVGVDDLAKVLGADTAVCMMTNPNTLGLFEDHIAEIAAAVHAAGGLMYYDGANANALMGNARPGDMGFDLMHLNTHKTFSIPHGGGGAGHGPIGVAAHLAKYLPTPVVIKEQDVYRLEFDRPDTIGAMRSFWSNFAHAVRALTYIRANGVEGLGRISQLAVLNANYVRVKVRDVLQTPYDEPCRHEFVASAQELKRETGVRALDIAKALLDRGFHAPTMYFPLLVPECLMIEPTETESKATLDAFIDALRDIVEQARREPEPVLQSPRRTPVRRIDETRAARQPDLRWSPSPSA
ncbi:MAG: aminomethyl-transferring glycine dehydrogenase subunit GcvPB [Candidatus Eremiobacteraeota bacterium]|nr:aminomethyl-transferring glycine dehydrogenase subunit GcvPB [Candidatus Eremiobacteraeota bacterium]